MNKELTEAGSKYIYLKESDEVAGPLLIEKPNRKDFELSGAYMSTCHKFSIHIEELPRYKVTGTHSWSDQQVLEEGEDFEWKDGEWEREYYPNGDYTGGKICKQFAIPIKSDSKEDKQKELEQAALYRRWKEILEDSKNSLAYLNPGSKLTMNDWHKIYENAAFIFTEEVSAILLGHSTPSTIEQGQQGDGWIEFAAGNPLPDYDEPAMWLFEDGLMIVDSLDKDGNPWLYGEPLDELGYPVAAKVTHWRPLPAPPIK